MLLLCLSLIAAARADVLLLELAAAPEEALFLEELALSLKQPRLEPGPEGFAAAPPEERGDGARPLLDDPAIAAVVWLDPADDPALLRAGVAYLEEDRAVVRRLDAPRAEGAEAELALATRALLKEVRGDEVRLIRGDEPEITSVEEALGGGGGALSPWRASASAAGVLPAHLDAGGARGGLGLSLERAAGGAWLGLGVEAQVRADQLRVGPALSARWRFLLAGARADWTHLEWADQLQPRVFAGVATPAEEGPYAALVLGVAPLREPVLRDGAVVYDAGRVELELRLGWSRRLRAGG